MEDFLKASFETIKRWVSGVFSANGFINGGWLVAALILLLFGFNLFAGISFGIFGEKNRSQLVKIYKQIREGK